MHRSLFPLLLACAALLVPAAVIAAPFAYITNANSDNVSVIDTATNTVTATIPVGLDPIGVAVNPAGTRVFVTNQTSDNVSVIDTATNTVTATIPVGFQPFAVAVNPAGTRVYITNTGNSTVSVIDTATNAVTATIPVGLGPTGVAVNPAGTRVFVTNTNSVAGNTVSVIDTSSNTVTATIPVGLGPNGVAVNPAGTRALVANSLSNNVSVIDTASNTVTATIPVGLFPRGVSVNPAGTRVYVTNANSNNVSVIDTATNTVLGAAIGVGANPVGVAVNPAGTRVFVANLLSNSVSVIDTATNLDTATVGVGSAPFAFGQFIGPGVGTSFTAPTATASGQATAAITGGGAACSISNPLFVAAPGPLPSGVSFPHGLFSFTATPCTVGGAVSVTITYPNPIPPGAQYFKYGLTAASPSTPVYYTIPATISGNQVTFTLTDGGSGDSDLLANGSIVDPGGIGLVDQAGVQGIPTLGEWALLMLMLGMATLAGLRMRQRG